MEFFELKTTTGTTKQAKENIQEIRINDGEVAWYLVKKTEPVMTWAQRVFKKPLTEKDWGILKGFVAQRFHNYMILKVLIIF
ncbi:hypothetical protein MY149_04500 [Acinetobacter indicus]|nr:hypothetical protein [Acinetobacter indicus]